MNAVDRFDSAVERAQSEQAIRERRVGIVRSKLGDLDKYGKRVAETLDQAGLRWPETGLVSLRESGLSLTQSGRWFVPRPGDGHDMPLDQYIDFCADEGAVEVDNKDRIMVGTIGYNTVYDIWFNWNWRPLLDCMDADVERLVSFSLAKKTQTGQVEHDGGTALQAIKITSGYNFEGYAITDYLGFLSEETVVGMGFFKSIAASVSDLTGTESASLRTKLTEARRTVMDRMRQSADRLGANAIIGLDLDYTMFGGSLLGVVVTGTAVSVSKIG